MKDNCRQPLVVLCFVAVLICGQKSAGQGDSQSPGAAFLIGADVSRVQQIHAMVRDLRRWWSRCQRGRS
ncbi:MAG: hypothetical protein JXB62_04020 [Pirellulales bacterium]|nr:hypothetical protein [Pirellulales bacterium]